MPREVGKPELLLNLMMEDAAARAGTGLFRQWQGGATDHQPPGHGQREGCSEGLLRAWWSKQRWLKGTWRGPFMRVWDECWLSLDWEQSSSIDPKGYFHLIYKPWMPALEGHVFTVQKLNPAYLSAHEQVLHHTLRYSFEQWKCWDHIC